ncbi:MAG: DUF4906 domain-containing protein [Alistipes sp.]|nr:DUF4906 domain-containing protein [Alistipes sp.]
MRYTRIIATILALIVAASCAVDNVDGPVVSTPTSGDIVSVMGRITRFDDCKVDTRSSKDEDEAYVTSMALAVFPINEDDSIGDCIDYTYLTGNNLLFSIDRGDKKYEGYNNEDEFALYIFANVPDMPHKLPDDGLTLDDLLDKAYSSNGILRPEDGFPMVGSLGDYVNAHGDGHRFKLNPNLVGGKKVLPTLDGEDKDLLNIPMKALFAKMTFSISVAADQSVKENDPPMFALSSYEVVNIPDGGILLEGSNTEQNVTANGSAEVTYSASTTGGASINFSFYLPERLLEPATKSADYDYPFRQTDGSIRREDSVYMQRFKGKLLGDNQKATHIILKGKFRDHQEQYFDVVYTIYLGANSYDDFNIKRNTQYFNTVTIMGITASEDQSLNGDGVAIDHRVNVESGLPIIVNLRRETLLDSHFEVRPLRVRYLDGEDVPNGAKVTVTVGKVNASDPEPNWVRVEHKNNDGGDSKYLSSGKRRYFTTDLVSTELAESGKSQEASLSKGSQETFWIYVDQCDEPAPLSDPNQMRKAKITVTYADADNMTQYVEPLEYIICQYKLFPVETVRNAGTANESTFVYYIEHEEEYLYNYDADDDYGQTKQEGMPWGLNSVQLSKEYFSFDPDLTPNVNWTTYETKAARPYYDFYIKKHDSFASDNGGTVREYPGQAFTQEIAKNAGIGKLTLAQTANSAVEYCYNRNKRDANGDVVEVEWYLPSADELEDFIVPAYGSFPEFQNNYYWTSQPAYIRNIFYYETSSTVASPTVYDDNKEYARATKVKSLGNNQFEYAKSGLDTEPTPYVNRTHEGYENLGYFYEMHYWKGSNDYGPHKDGTQPGGDERYTTKSWFNKKNYYIHLGFLDDMMQEGYHHRTKSNRVRCVRNVVTQNQQ